MEYLFIYLLQVMDVIDGIVFTSWLVFAGFIVALIVNCVATSINNDSFIPDKKDKEYNTDCYRLYVVRKYITKGCIISILTAFLLSLIPTKHTLLLIGGTHLAKQTIKSEVVNKKLEKINDIIDIQLEQYLKDLKSQAK